MQEKIKEILDQIETVIVGKNEVMERILMAILAGGHVLMEDVPGVGKTTTAMTFARVLGLETRRVQFTSDTMPSDIIGFSVYDKDTGKLVYKPGAVVTNLLLADEINRTSSKTQSALLEAMEEGHVSIDGKTHPLPDPFIVLATQNPAGSAGTQMLPNSQLDRFLVKLTMGYPDFKSQVSILEERHTENPLDRVHPVVGAEELNALKQRAAAVEMKTSVYEYVTRLAEATRVHSLVQLGLSPRGALAGLPDGKGVCLCAGPGLRDARGRRGDLPGRLLPPPDTEYEGPHDGAQRGADRGRNPEKRGNAGDPEEPGGRMTVLRIGYALLLLTVLGLDAFCGSILSAAATALLVLTPLVCALLHLRAAKKLRVRLDAPVNLEKGEEGTLRIRVENTSALPVCLLGVRLRLTNLLTGQTAVRTTG